MGRPTARTPGSWSSTTGKKRAFLSRRSSSFGRCVIQPAGTPKQRIGTAELRLALQEALSRRSGTQQRVVEFKRRPSSYSTSFAIEELDVRLQDGTSLKIGRASCRERV